MMARTKQTSRSRKRRLPVDKVSHDTTEPEVKRIYNEWASDYEHDIHLDVYCRPLAESLDGAIKQVYKDKTKDEIKIIDVGAGTGLIGKELHKLGYTDQHALDISPEMLNEAKEKNVYKSFICSSLSDKSIPEDDKYKYDALVSGGTLEKGHLRPHAFDKMLAMVKTSGVLCFTIHELDLDDYQAKMLDLEKEGRWKLISKVTVPTVQSVQGNFIVFTYEICAE